VQGTWNPCRRACIGFFNAFRESQPVTRNLLDAPAGRRYEFVDRYFKYAKNDELAPRLFNSFEGNCPVAVELQFVEPSCRLADPRTRSAFIASINNQIGISGGIK
jgi:hypothetical protein